MLSRLYSTLILVPSVVALASPAWAESRVNAEVTQPRPLNLSLPRDVLGTAGAGQADEALQRNLRAPLPLEGAAPAPVRLPYGAGYEHRHQETGRTPPGASARAGAGTGAGRRGR